MRVLLSYLPALACAGMMLLCFTMMRGGSKKSCCNLEQHAETASAEARPQVPVGKDF